MDSSGDMKRMKYWGHKEMIYNVGLGSCVGQENQEKKREDIELITSSPHHRREIHTPQKEPKI